MDISRSHERASYITVYLHTTWTQACLYCIANPLILFQQWYVHGHAQILFLGAQWGIMKLWMKYNITWSNYHSTSSFTSSLHDHRPCSQHNIWLKGISTLVFCKMGNINVLSMAMDINTDWMGIDIEQTNLLGGYIGFTPSVSPSVRSNGFTSPFGKKEKKNCHLYNTILSLYISYQDITRRVC